MSLRSHRNLKLVGALGSAALAIGAVASAPALAAAAGSSASVAYTCTTQFGPAAPTADYVVKAAPATMAVGQPLKTTATFTLDAATTGLAVGGLGWTKFNGTIASPPSGSLAGLALKIPKTTLGNGTAGTTVSQATGSTLVGSKTGKFSLSLGNLGKVVLNGFDASGSKGSVAFPSPGATGNGRCNNNAGTTPLQVGGTSPVTVKVVKDTTKTAEKAKFAAKKSAATGTAKVKSKFGSAATGKVTFTLKKGSKTVKTAKGKINKKGVATVTFKGVKASGKYSITGKYAGSKTLKGSSGKATFTVK